MRNFSSWGIAGLAIASVTVLAVSSNAVAQSSIAGRAVFVQSCAACHQEDGKGIPGLAPALAGTLSPLFKSEDGKNYLSRVLLSGLSGKIVSQGQTYVGAMPAVVSFSDSDLAEVANFVAVELNGALSRPYISADFQNARGSKATHKDLRELRARLLP